MIGISFRQRVSCTIAECRKATGLGKTKIYEMIDQKRIEVRKVGRRTVILFPSLLAAIEGPLLRPHPRSPTHKRSADPFGAH